MGSACMKDSCSWSGKREAKSLREESPERVVGRADTLFRTLIRQHRVVKSAFTFNYEEANMKKQVQLGILPLI